MSKKEATNHWIAQRMSAGTLIILVVWLMYAFFQVEISPFRMTPAEARDFYVEWISNPVNAVMTTLLLITMFYHGALGMQVIFEDYVSNESKRKITITVVNLLSLAAAAIGTLSIISMYFIG